MFRSLCYQGCRVEGRAQARAGDRQLFSIYLDWRLAAMRGMRTPMIVEAHPVTDSLTGFPPAREGMQVNALVFQRAPQPFSAIPVVKTNALGLGYSSLVHGLFNRCLVSDRLTHGTSLSLITNLRL